MGSLVCTNSREKCGTCAGMPVVGLVRILTPRIIIDASASRYGDQVENYLEVYLRTPNLSKEDMTKALMVRGNARKSQGERLIDKALQGPYLNSPCR